jgi:hypothetical protein
VQHDGDTFSLEVRNDGVRADGGGGPGAGMGLRLAAFEALQHGGFVEFGPDKSCDPPGWRVRLVVPVPVPASSLTADVGGEGIE